MVQLDRHILNELADMESEVIRDYEDLYFPGGALLFCSIATEAVLTI